MEEGAEISSSAPPELAEVAETRPLFDESNMPLNLPHLERVLDSLVENPTVDHVKAFIAEYNIEELREPRNWISSVLGAPPERTKQRRLPEWRKWLTSIPDHGPDVCTSCHKIETDESMPEPVEEDESSDTDVTAPKKQTKKRVNMNVHPFHCTKCTVRQCTTYGDLMEKLKACRGPRHHAKDLFQKAPNNMSVFERCIEVPYLELEKKIEARIKTLHRVAADFVLDRPVKANVGMMCTPPPPFHTPFLFASFYFDI